MATKTTTTATAKVSRISFIVNSKGTPKDTLDRMADRIRRSVDNAIDNIKDAIAERELAVEQNAMKLGQSARAGQTDNLAKLHDEYLTLCAEIRSLKEDLKAMEDRKASFDEEIEVVED